MESNMTFLATGMRMPNMSLESLEGTRVEINGYRHRCNLIVAFVAGAESESSTQVLAQLAKRIADFDFENASVLAVVKGSWEAAAQLQRRYDLPFPVLVDEDGSAHRAVGSWPADGAALAIFVLDRYGKIYAVYGPSGEVAPPDTDEIVEWLQFVNLQCPECGVPEWPARSP